MEDWGNDVWGDVESSSPFTPKNLTMEEPPLLSHETSEPVFDSQKDLVEAHRLEESFSQLLTPSNHFSFHIGHEKSQISVDEGVWDPLREIPSDIPASLPIPSPQPIITDTIEESIPVNQSNTFHAEPEFNSSLLQKQSFASDTAPWIEDKKSQVIVDPLGDISDPNISDNDGKDTFVSLHKDFLIGLD